jgi:hypothetical protein
MKKSRPNTRIITIGFYKGFGSILFSGKSSLFTKPYLFRFLNMDDLPMLFILMAGTLWPAEKIGAVFLVTETNRGVVPILAGMCKAVAFKLGAEFFHISRRRAYFKTNPIELQAIIGSGYPKLFEGVSTSYRIPLAFSIECLGIKEGPLGGPMKGI